MPTAEKAHKYAQYIHVVITWMVCTADFSCSSD